MKLKPQSSSEPSWLDPSRDRKSPFTDAELVALVDDFIAGMADTKICQDLIAELGQRQARAVVKKHLAAQDVNSLFNSQPHGALH